jgi:hypothetical protein
MITKVDAKTFVGKDIIHIAILIKAAHYLQHDLS